MSARCSGSGGSGGGTDGSTALARGLARLLGLGRFRGSRWGEGRCKTSHEILQKKLIISPPFTPTPEIALRLRAARRRSGGAVAAVGSM